MSVDAQDSSGTLWVKLKATTLDAAKATLPVQKRRPEKPWISDEALQLIDEKRNIPRDALRYKELTRAIKAAVKTDRRQHYEGICDKIELANAKGNRRQVFRTLEKL